MPHALTLPRLPARRVPLTVLLGVLALHAVLLWMAARLGVWPDRVGSTGPTPLAPPPFMLWLLDRDAPQPAPAAERSPLASPRRTAPAPTARLPVRPALQHQPPAAPGEPQSITLPLDAATPTPTPSRAAEAASPPGSAPAALNLTLPRGATAAWRQRGPALDDARANTRAPGNMATLIAQALGGDPHGAISEEHLADGSVRFKRASQCVIARPNQAQNIDPFNGSVLPKPRLLDRC
jgi:hypothetical protein